MIVASTPHCIPSENNTHATQPRRRWLVTTVAFFRSSLSCMTPPTSIRSAAPLALVLVLVMVIDRSIDRPIGVRACARASTHDISSAVTLRCEETVTLPNSLCLNVCHATMTSLDPRRALEVAVDAAAPSLDLRPSERAARRPPIQTRPPHASKKQRRSEWAAKHTHKANTRQHTRRSRDELHLTNENDGMPLLVPSSVSSGCARHGREQRRRNTPRRAARSVSRLLGDAR